MGDRCYMQITCRKQDVQEFEDLGFTLEIEHADGTVVVTDPEVNYGNTEDLPRHLPFTGWHGAGDCYGGMAFASDGERFAEVQTTHDDELCVLVNEVTGEPVPESVERMRHFLAVQRTAKTKLIAKGE
jgi:hypothetical protein